MSTTESQSDDGRTGRTQFSLGSLFGMFFALGLYFAYLRQLHPLEVLYGCYALLLGLAVGALGGLIGRRWVEPIYWSTLCTAFAFVSVAGEPTFNLSFCFVWSTVGSACGAVCGMVARRRPVMRVLAGGLAGALVMWPYLLLTGTMRSNSFDAICAPVIGALLGVLIEIIQFVELDRRLPRYTIATWLLCAVLVGNILVPYFV